MSSRDCEAGVYGMVACEYVVLARWLLVGMPRFLLTPNPMHAGFAHMWRTGNDISADWNTIMNRIDMVS